MQGEEHVAALSLVPLTPTSPTPPSNIAHQVVDAKLEGEEIKTAPHNYSSNNNDNNNNHKERAAERQQSQQEQSSNKNSMMASSDGGGGSIAEGGSAVSKAPLPARSNVILAKEVQQGLAQASAARSSSRFAGSKLRRKGVQEEPARAPSSLAPHPIVDNKMALFRSGSYRLDRRATSANVATPSWRPDKEVKECQGCKARFTLVKRRHHCRSCGDIFCEDCSSHSISVSSLYLLQSDQHSLAASTCSSRLSQPASSLSDAGDGDGDGDGDGVENAAVVTDATTPTTNSSARKRSVVRVCDGCWIKVQMMLDGRGLLERDQKRTGNSNTAWRNSFRLSKKSKQATGPLHRSSDSHRSVGGKSDPSTGVGPALTGTRNRTSAKQSSRMALHRSHSTLSTSTSTLSSAPLSAAAAAAALARRGRSRGPGAANAISSSGAQVPPEWQRIAKEKQEAGKRMAARHQVAMEILNTEKTYVKNLSLVVRGLLVPLRQANKVLNEEQIQGVFLNLEELLNEHTSFLVLLEKRINQWNADATVADLFLNHTEFLLKYEVYMKEYSTSQILLSYLLEKYPAFLKAKGDFETKTSGLSLEDFLIQPIQRLPRYCLLLERMQAYTTPNTIAHEEIKCAHAKVERVLANLHQGIAQDQSQANASVKKLLSLEQSLSQLLSQDLYSTKRRFVRESAVWWSLHVQDAAQNMGRTVREKADTDTADIVLDNFCTQQHTLYLFNDMILCCGNVTIDSFANQQAERERKEKERKEQKLLEADTKAKDSTQTINQRSNKRNQGENNPTGEPIAATDESRELPANVPVATPSDMDDSSNHQKQVEPAPPSLLPTPPPTSSLEEEESLWLEQVPFAVVLNLNNVASIRDGYGGGLEGGSSYSTGVFLGTSPRNRHSQSQPRHYHDLQNTSPLSFEDDAVNPNSCHLDASSSAADATKSGKLQTVDATSSQSLIPEVAASHPLAGSYKAPSAFAAFQQHQISKESEVTTPPALGTEPVFPVAAASSVGLNRQNGMPLMARKPSCVFHVWTAKECWNIYFSTEEEKNLWLTDITKCIHDLLVQKYNLF